MRKLLRKCPGVPRCGQRLERNRFIPTDYLSVGFRRPSWIGCVTGAIGVGDAPESFPSTRAPSASCLRSSAPIALSQISATALFTVDLSLHAFQSRTPAAPAAAAANTSTIRLDSDSSTASTAPKTTQSKPNAMSTSARPRAPTSPSSSLLLTRHNSTRLLKARTSMVDKGIGRGGTARSSRRRTKGFPILPAATNASANRRSPRLPSRR